MSPYCIPLVSPGYATYPTTARIHHIYLRCSHAYTITMMVTASYPVMTKTISNTSTTMTTPASIITIIYSYNLGNRGYHDDTGARYSHNHTSQPHIPRMAACLAHESPPPPLCPQQPTIVSPLLLWQRDHDGPRGRVYALKAPRPIPSRRPSGGDDFVGLLFSAWITVSCHGNHDDFFILLQDLP